MAAQGKRWSVLAAAVLGALLIGCAGETTRAPEQAASDAAEEMKRMRQEAKAEMKAHLDNLEQRLATLRQDAHQTGKKVEQGWDESVADLERKTTELRREWEQMENQGEDAWDAFSDRAKRAFSEIESGLKEAADKIG